MRVLGVARPDAVLLRLVAAEDVRDGVLPGFACGVLVFRFGLRGLVQ